MTCCSFNHVLINQKQNHKQTKIPFIIGLDSDSIHQIDRKLLAVKVCRFTACVFCTLEMLLPSCCSHNSSFNTFFTI